MRSISHEIRTPLNTIFIGFDVLIEEINKAGDYPALIDTVIDLQSSGNTALGIINDFLTYDKLDAGILKLELERQPYWRLIQSTIRPFFIQVIGNFVFLLHKTLSGPLVSQARQKRIELNLHDSLHSATDTSLSGLMVYVDGIKVGQVIRNLISNALKFSPPETKVSVFASVVSMENELPLPDEIKSYYGSAILKTIRLSVIDEGPGLNKVNEIVGLVGY